VSLPGAFQADAIGLLKHAPLDERPNQRKTHTPGKKCAFEEFKRSLGA
jgi:hypothetical protein